MIVKKIQCYAFIYTSLELPDMKIKYYGHMDIYGEVPGVKTWGELEFLLTMGKDLLFCFIHKGHRNATKVKA